MQLANKRRLRRSDGAYSRQFQRAADIAALLNNTRGKLGIDRLENVIFAINEIDRMASRVGYSPKICAGISQGLLGERPKQLMKIVQDFTADFKIVAGLGDPRAEGWTHSHILFGGTLDRRKINSYIAAPFVLDAAWGGYLRLVSQCLFCGIWFVTRRRDHKFCSGKCREKAFRGSEEGKAKRAKFMREYRARLKRRDAANLRVTTSLRR